MSKSSKNYIGIVVAAVVIGAGFLFSQRDSSTANNSASSNLYPEQSITHGHGLAVDVKDSSKLYIATHNGLLLLQNEKDLYRVGKSKDDYMGFSPHPTNPQVFFTSGHPRYGGNIGFQKSEDGGFTWQKVSNGLNGPVDFHAMAVSPVDPDLVFGWYKGDLQRTTDGGETWEKFPTAVPVVQLAADTKNENIVYAATPAGLHKSSDKGQSWQQLFEGFVSAVAVHPQSQGLLSFSEKFGLASSNDGGQIWERIEQNFNGETPLFISFYRRKPELVYLLTEKNSVYKSSDSGAAWNKIR